MRWLSMTEGVPNTTLDTQLRASILPGHDILVLNGELEGFGTLVTETKAQFPTLKVLRYVLVFDVPETTKISGTFFNDCLANGSAWGLRRPNGTVFVGGSAPNRTCFMDLSKAEYRDAAVAHFATQVIAHGCDGILVDNLQTTLDWEDYFDPSGLEAVWLDGVKAFLDALVAALPGKLVMYNGLWDRKVDQLNRQAQLLSHCNGAFVEHYPRNFDQVPNAQNINAVAQANPSKRIHFRGGFPGGNFYKTYTEDYKNAMFSYAWFLIGGLTANSDFSYGQNLQVTRYLAQERSTALFQYDFEKVYLGSPIDVAQQTITGGWWRRFNHGTVYLAPDSLGAQSFVTDDGWSMAGKRYRPGRSVTIPAGEALIITHDRPAHVGLSLDVDVAQHPTEWLLQNVSSEVRYKYLLLTVTSQDVDSYVTFRFETNDSPRPYGKLTVAPIGGTVVVVNLDNDYGSDGELGVSRPAVQYLYSPVGTSTHLINLETACSPYPQFRVVSARAWGNVTVDRIRLFRPTGSFRHLGT